MCGTFPPTSTDRILPPFGDPTTVFVVIVWKVCVYGKPEGAGTGVTLSNTRYSGLGVPIPYDQETGVCGAVSIRGLAPNESYVSDLKTCGTAVAGILLNAGTVEYNSIAISVRRPLFIR